MKKINAGLEFHHNKIDNPDRVQGSNKEIDMYQDIIGLEQQARLRVNELRRDRARYGADDLGILSLVARIAGGIGRAARAVERWATRPAPHPTELPRSHRWHNS